MIKKIYYYELLEMIRNHTNPYEVYYNHKRFVWNKYAKVYMYTYDDNYGRILTRTLLDERLKNVGGWFNNIEPLLSKFRVTYKTDILDKTEKKYLYNIVKPYLNDYYITVMKISHPDNKENITIFLNDLSCPVAPVSAIELPKFEKGSMYKGMDTKNAIYDLSELGVCCEY